MLRDLGEFALALVAVYFLYLVVSGLRDKLRYLCYKYSRTKFHF